MTIINTSPDRPIQLGYEGEDKVTILRFGYSEKWLKNGEGIFTVRVLRNGENQAYNAQLIEDDRENYTIDMTVTDVELSIQGYGEMQLVYTGANFVKKSPVYKYYVSRSIDEAVDPPEGDVYTQIIESLADLRVDFNELSDIVSEINDNIGDLAELTTANKLNIVESINEVNAKSFVSVDDELSDASTNPVQNKVITSRIISAESAIQGKANVQIVSALSDDVSDLQTDVQGLADAVDGIGNLAELTTEAKTDLVSAINEVNDEHGGGGSSVTVDDALSNVSENPVQNKVITARINSLASDVGTLRTSVQSKADIQTVSALSDAVNGLDGDVQGLQTAVQSKADTATVTALSGAVSGLQTAVQSKADAQTVTALSGTVTNLQTGKADKSYVDTQLAGKASTATATTSSDGLMSAQDKSRLDAVYTDYSSALTALGVIE